MARYGFQRRHESERLHAAWDEILVEFLPASFSGSTRPGNIRRGILEVQIVHSALIQELSFSESRILEKLKEKIPELKIRKIKYVVNF